jgi:hypothetical protein
MMPERVKMAAKLMKEPEVPVAQIGQTLNVSRSTFYRYVGPGGQVRKV